jgi:hypothetical protein
MTADTTTSASGAEPRAFVLLKSRRRLDLLDPDPQAWTDDDLAAGLSRTIRWGGASRWEHPLSVAQQSLTVLTIGEVDGTLSPGEALSCQAGTASRRSKRSSANRSASLMRDCRARSTHAIDSRNGHLRLTRSTSARRRRRRRVRSFPCRGLDPGRHTQDPPHRGSPAPRRSSFAVRFRALGALALARCPEAVHRTVQCTRTHPSTRTADDPLLRPPFLSHSRWSRTSCRILMMTPHSTLTQIETRILRRMDGGRRLGRPLIIRNAISPIVARLLVTRDRSSCWPGQGPERPRP